VAVGAILLIYPAAVALLKVFDHEEWEKLKSLAWQ